MIRPGLIFLNSHPWYGQVLAKLKKEQREAVERFLKDNAALGKKAFSLKLLYDITVPPVATELLMVLNAEVKDE